MTYLGSAPVMLLPGLHWTAPLHWTASCPPGTQHRIHHHQDLLHWIPALSGSSQLAFNLYRGFSCISTLTEVPALPCGFTLDLWLTQDHQKGTSGVVAVSCVRLASTSYQVGAPCCCLLAAKPSRSLIALLLQDT